MMNKEIRTGQLRQNIDALDLAIKRIGVAHADVRAFYKFAGLPRDERYYEAKAQFKVAATQALEERNKLVRELYELKKKDVL